MTDFFEQISWDSFWSLSTVISVVDILIVSFFIYQIIQIIRGTKVNELFKGILVIIAIKVASSIFQLHTTEYIIDFVIQWSTIALIVIFQPELRRGLEHLGRSSVFSSKKTINASDKLIEDIAEACEYMSKRHIGALISLQMQTGLDEYIKTGIKIDSAISRELLINIFIPNTPLHDGAVIISDYKIASAASYLPLSDSPIIPKRFGTRHRAAIGLAEQTDAITLVVSEETGEVSIAHRSDLMTDFSKEDIINYLTAQLSTDESHDDQSWWGQIVETIRKGVDGE